jgi:hypothetical protein
LMFGTYKWKTHAFQVVSWTKSHIGSDEKES